ncbi:hypothetical protein [Sinorhizobium meliloti]|uniref:hypothetical protein n=1 Tax=Rhizobium meliloti TaxID=382 RepID=UPI001F2DFE25|nr:hypothetical protein [Sinorhizobium meliloti]
MAVSTCATRPGPGLPRSIGSDGIIASTSVSQPLQVKRGCTWRTTRKGWNIVEHLGDSLAAADEVGTTADRAGASRLVNDLLSRQMIRNG